MARARSRSQKIESCTARLERRLNRTPDGLVVEHLADSPDGYLDLPDEDLEEQYLQLEKFSRRIAAGNRPDPPRPPGTLPPEEPAATKRRQKKKNAELTRQEALARILAGRAEREESVRAFRAKHLDGQALSEVDGYKWMIGKRQEQMNKPREDDGSWYREFNWAEVSLVPKEHEPTELDRKRLGEALAELEAVSRYHAKKYGWTESQAEIFVLAGSVPEIPLVRWAGGGLNQEMPVCSRLVLEIDPVTTPDEVKAEYARLRKHLLSEAKIRRQSSKHLGLALFHERTNDEGTWAERMALWNKEQPRNSRSRYPKNRVHLFARDCQRAHDRLMRPAWGEMLRRWCSWE